MTDTEKVKRIEGLLNELDLRDLTEEEIQEEIMESSINDIIDDIWKLYCFAENVFNTVNE